jgi:formylglycine-generating enzyme required for sulfatase activity
VTNEQFKRFVQENDDYATPGKRCKWPQSEPRCSPDLGLDWQRPEGKESSIEGISKHPVVLINWEEATAYCRWADKRLPTAVEWRLGAFGTDGRTYPWGDEEPSGRFLNYCDAQCEGNQPGNDGFPRSSPVCSFPDGNSPYGLCDMGGNVWEWVDDWDIPNEKRMIRGGAWAHPPSDASSSGGISQEYDVALDVLGFRCARSADFGVTWRDGKWVRDEEP